MPMSRKQAGNRGGRRTQKNMSYGPNQWAISCSPSGELIHRLMMNYEMSVMETGGRGHREEARIIHPFPVASSRRPPAVVATGQMSATSLTPFHGLSSFPLPHVYVCTLFAYA